MNYRIPSAAFEDWTCPQIQDGYNYGFIITLFVRLYVRVGILLTCGKHLHDRIISLRGEVWSHKASLVPLFFYEVSFPSQKCERSCICLLGLSFLSLSTIFQLEHQSSLPVTYWGWLCSIYRYLCRVLKIMVCFCLFFCWPLYYLSFFDLLLLITTAN